MLTFANSTETTEEFGAVQTLRVQNRRALDMGYLNGIKLLQMGARQFGKRLNKVLEPVGEEGGAYPQSTSAATAFRYCKNIW